MKYRGGEKNYETNVTNCKRYWSTFQPNEPKQMFEQRKADMVSKALQDTKDKKEKNKSESTIKAH